MNNCFVVIKIHTFAAVMEILGVISLLDLATPWRASKIMAIYRTHISKLSSDKAQHFLMSPAQNGRGPRHT